MSKLLHHENIYKLYKFYCLNNLITPYFFLNFTAYYLYIIYSLFFIRTYYFTIRNYKIFLNLLNDILLNIISLITFIIYEN